MGNISKQIDKINYCIYHNPTLIPTLFKDTSIKKGLLYSRLRRAVPHRIGIEFEGYGHFINEFIRDKFPNENIKDITKFVKEYYGLYDFNEDGMSSPSGDPIDALELCNPVLTTDIELEAQPQLIDANLSFPSGGTLTTPDDPIPNPSPIEISQPEVEKIKLTEVRVSIKDFTQLKGLFNILEDMKDYCKIVDGGGIHIHVDFSEYFQSDTNIFAKKWVLNHLDRVEKIFPKYTGKYNRRDVGIQTKATYVNFSYHKSIEFRIAPLTYNYEILIKWIIDCGRFVSDLIKECHLVKESIKNSKNKVVSLSEEILENIYHLENIVGGSNDVYIRVDSGSGTTTDIWTYATINANAHATSAIAVADIRNDGVYASGGTGYY